MAIGERKVRHPISAKELGLIGTAAVTISGAALGSAILLSRDRGPQNPPSEPVKASDPLRPNEPAQAILPVGTKLAQVEWTPTTVPSPTATEVLPTATSSPEPSPTPKIVKKIPDEINKRTLEEANRNIVVWSAEQTEAVRAEAAQIGKIIFPLGRQFIDVNTTIQPIYTKDGLIITVDPDTVFESEALVEGIVVKAGNSNKTMDIVTIQDKSGIRYSQMFPPNGNKIFVKQGQRVKADQKIYQASYDKNFADTLQSRGAPPNARAFIGVNNQDGSLYKVSIENIMTDPTGNLVTIGSPSLGIENVDINPDLVAYMAKGNTSRPS